MMILRCFSSAVLLALSMAWCMGAHGGSESTVSPPAKRTPALAQWESLKYGMFIHFGMSTFTGIEQDPGKLPSATYAPTDLDVDQWIRVARDAGMKYAVLTAKHASGHCLWDSKVSWQGKEYDYDVATSGNKTDVVAAFMKACKKYGLRPGLYYCLLDYRNNPRLPNKPWQADRLPKAFFQLVQDHLAELLHRYPDVFYFWLDIPRAATPEQRTELYALIKRIKPACIVLFNHGMEPPKGPATIADFQAAWPTDILNTERFPLQVGWFTPLQSWQGQQYYLGYEHCDTICKYWFWRAGDQPRPVAELRALAKQVADAGGNLLLNVPPNKTGRLPDSHIQALMELKNAK